MATGDPYVRYSGKSNCANVAAANPQSDKANNFAKINMRDYGAAGGRVYVCVCGWVGWLVALKSML